MLDGAVVKEHNKLRIVSEEFHSLQRNHWSCIMLFGHHGWRRGCVNMGISTRIHAAGAPRQWSHSLKSEFSLEIVAKFFTLLQKFCEVIILLTSFL